MTSPQNDPDRAGGLISDAQGEFVQEEPGGVFDPRAFRAGSATPPAPVPAGAAPDPSSVPAGDPSAPQPDQDATASQPSSAPFVPPGEEIDKAR
ncbi:hypothetical protein [Actinoplanes sp. RD1]|uniref:hypothetical protein n=1 Tax=Actinoplanes sp. RD1 TaxID=3064538 RepID=UPI0027417403|nr:hypothetical protein [Actinoplanes sp. RD1]